MDIESSIVDHCRAAIIVFTVSALPQSPMRSAGTTALCTMLIKEIAKRRRRCGYGVRVQPLCAKIPLPKRVKLPCLETREQTNALRPPVTFAPPFPNFISA